MSKQPNYVFDDELYHHGIQGQRWGFRRFQNEDGSWTPEGRERYGEGDARSKAKATYETQKYKLNLKSKAQKEKDRRAAKEERNRIKEAGKTARVIKKEQAKTDQEGRGKAKFRSTKKMSDEELQSAIDRLKLQSEYNKQYALAKKPDGALAKADRFFEGPTGKAVTQIAVATLPNVANTVVSKVLDSKLKYANKEDREAAEAATAKTRAEAESFVSKTKFQNAQTSEKLANIRNTNLKEALSRMETMKESNRKNAELKSKLANEKQSRTAAENKEKQERANTETKARREAGVEAIINRQVQTGQITVDEALEKLKKYGLI